MMVTAFGIRQQTMYPATATTVDATVHNRHQIATPVAFMMFVPSWWGSFRYGPVLPAAVARYVSRPVAS
jgi:hypothetical protein